MRKYLKIFKNWERRHPACKTENIVILPAKKNDADKMSMLSVFLIVKTELYQLLRDRRLIIAMIVFLLIFLIGLLSLLFSYPELNSQQLKWTSEFSAILFLFCLLSFSMSTLVIADITAGEKERNTLESLFMTQCPRKIIFWGKFLVGYLFSLLPLVIGALFMLFFCPPHVVPELASVLAGGIYPPTFMGGAGGGIKIFRLFFLLLPYTFFIVSLLIHNGFKAKSIRSAKSSELLIFICIPFFSILLNQLLSAIGVTIYICFIIILCYFLNKKTIRFIKSEKALLN